MSEQLKPCPFCGLVPILKHYQRGAFVTDYWVTCPQCKIEIGRNGVPSKAIAAWNTRPVDPVKQALAEALKLMRRRFGKNQFCNDPTCTVCEFEVGITKKADDALAAFEKENSQ